MSNQGTKKEKIQGIIIAILSLIIVFGGAYFASELKYCDQKEELRFEEIGFNEFVTLLNDNNKSIIYIARPGCTFCQRQQPILKGVMNDNNLLIYYLNTDNLTEENMKYIYSLDVDTFGENGKEFGTPTILIVNKGEISEAIVGLTQKDDLVNFFKKHNFIK